MPIFDYECLECQKKFSYKHTAKKVKKICESCGGELQKILFENLSFREENIHSDERPRALKKQLEEFKNNLKREKYEP